MSNVSTTITALRWEWFRLYKRPGLWFIIGAVSIIVTLVIAGAALVNYTTESIVDRMTAVVFTLFVSEALIRIGPLLAVILTAIIFGSEYNWGSWRTIAIKGQPRWQTSISKLLLVAAIITTTWTIYWLIAMISGIIITQQLSSDEGASWYEAFQNYKYSLLVSLAYSGFAAFIATVTKSQTWALACGLSLIMMEALAYPITIAVISLLTDFPIEQILRWTLWGVGHGLYGNDSDLSYKYFVPAIFAYIAAFWALPTLILTKQDLPGLKPAE